MLRIPLLLGANPRVANPGVWIPIEFDRWQVRVEGLDDSELTFCSSWSGNRKFPFNEATFNGAIFNGPCKVKIEIKKRGTEKSISVFAVRYE